MSVSLFISTNYIGMKLIGNTWHLDYTNIFNRL